MVFLCNLSSIWPSQFALFANLNVKVKINEIEIEIYLLVSDVFGLESSFFGHEHILCLLQVYQIIMFFIAHFTSGQIILQIYLILEWWMHEILHICSFRKVLETCLVSFLRAKMWFVVLFFNSKIMRLSLSVGFYLSG